MRLLEQKWFWTVLGAVYAIVAAMFLSYLVREILLVPIVALAGLGIIYYTRQTLFFIAAITPLSMNMDNLVNFEGIGFYFPTEPLLAGILVVFVIWAFMSNGFDKKLAMDSFSILLYAHLLWIFITACSSTMPSVSFKFLAGRLWFVIPLYLMAASYFYDKKLLRKYFWGYVLMMALVIVITLVKHAEHGFSEEVGHFVMSPYFKDHTSYGAMIAMFFPMVLGYLFLKGLSVRWRIAILLVAIVFSLGLVFSYTRAAWLSLVAAAGVFVIMKLRIKFWLVFTVGVTLLTGFVLFQDDLVRELERNRQDSSENFAEHIQSMTNISTDASNLERINRWNCALRMWEEKPLVGYGPGTYMFQYAPFQKSSELTIISTNLGRGGNAHSEYLGPLSEQGVLGMVFFLLIMILILYRGITLYYKVEDRETRMLVMAFILGLVTYFSHGVLNNFLDTDKASVPFWGFCAGIIAVDLYHQKRIVNKAISSKGGSS